MLNEIIFNIRFYLMYLKLTGDADNTLESTEFKANLLVALKAYRKVAQLIEYFENRVKTVNGPTEVQEARRELIKAVNFRGNLQTRLNDMYNKNKQLYVGTIEEMLA